MCDEENEANAKEWQMIFLIVFTLPSAGFYMNLEMAMYSNGLTSNPTQSTCVYVSVLPVSRNTIFLKKMNQNKVYNIQ